MSFDLAIFQGQKPNTVLRYASAATLQGTAKLVNRFAFLFLSDYDSTRDRGTYFNAAMRAGTIRTNSQILQQFALAAAEVTRQLYDFQDKGDRQSRLGETSAHALLPSV